MGFRPKSASGLCYRRTAFVPGSAVPGLESSVEVVILDMRHTHAIDASAIDALTRLLKHCNNLEIKLCLTHVQDQPMKVLDRMGFVVKVGESNIYETKTEAIEKAYDYIKHLEAS